MGIDFAAAEDIPPETEKRARQGEAAMSNTVATENAALAISGGGESQRSFEEVLQKSQSDLTKVRQIISQGGFTGAEKDKYMMSLHHAEWAHSRNLYMKCDNSIKETSVKYTALVDGKSESHEIAKAHKVWKDTRDKCQKSGADLSEKANQYIETDRRARANKKAEEDIYPSVGQQGFQVRSGSGGRSGGGGGGGGVVEGFAGLGIDEVKEGFDFYNGSAVNANTDVPGTTNPVVKTFNARLPRYNDGERSTTDGQTILPWGEYYTDCAGVDDTIRPTCEKANKAKDSYIDSINTLFDKSDRLLNTYHKLHTLGGGTASAELEKLLLNNSDIKSIMENQKKNIALYKQNAIYDYDEYNSLAFYEDLVGFLYYAVFVIFLVMSLRDFFSSASGSYDKRNIIILILLGIYPKYILPIVLWIFDGFAKITDMLGLKNVRFWRE